MLAMSIRQPHVHAILHLGKRFENREDSRGGVPAVCRHVGPLLLHASGSMTQEEFWGALDAWRDDGRVTGAQHAKIMASLRARRPGGPLWPTWPLGGIVGVARAIGLVRPSPHGTPLFQVPGERPRPAALIPKLVKFDPRWWAGGHALVLADVHELPFVKCPGRLGLWRPTADVLRRLGPELRKLRAP